MKHTFYIVFLFISTLVFAQQIPITNVSTKIETIQGKKYYLHEVLQGQTLYSIAKAYKIRIQDIISENPESAEVLKAGTKLKIPVDKILSDDKSAQTDEFYVIHKLEKGETLYSISKKYSVSQGDILKENPSFNKEDIKVGDYLRIPLHLSKLDNPIKLVDKNKFIVYKVKKKETFYSISKKFDITLEALIEANPQYASSLPEGAIIEIPMYYEVKIIEKKIEAPAEIDSVLVFEEKKFLDVYNIALMLPFYLDNNETSDLITNSEETIYPQTLPVLEFYEGMLLAIDSLKKQGLSCNFFVYDISNDINIISKLIHQPEFPSLNLIFYPIVETNFFSLMKYAEQKNIKIISSHAPDSILISQPNVCNIFPDDYSKIRGMAEYIANTYKRHNIILVLNNDSTISLNDSTKLKATKERIFAEYFKRNKKLFPSIKEVVLKKSGMSGLYNALIPNDTTIVVLLTKNQAVVSNIITNLNYKSNSDRNGKKSGYKIILFGMEELKDFENLEITYLHNLSLHIYSTSYIDYQRNDVKNFIKKYREHYKTEPSLYAFQGYDIAYYFLKKLKDYGVNFNYFLPEIKENLLQTRFNFEKIGKKGGYQNKYVYILKYEDYELKPVSD